MQASDYQERIWEGLPEGLEPSDFDLRLAFLLGGVAAGASVLDVGCGEGRFAEELVRAGCAVTAVDVAREPLRRARLRVPALDVRLLACAGGWELPDSAYDVVWAGEVLEHVADTAVWLSEARRVLRSGGRLLLSTPAHEPLTRLRMGLSEAAFARVLDPLSDHLRFYTRPMLARLIGEFGFDQVHVRAAGGLPGARRVLLASAVRSRF